MDLKDNAKKSRQYANDQRIEINPSRELRKGVNVLNTSDPKNPASNPFVPAQNQKGSNNNGTAQAAATPQPAAKPDENK